MVTTSPFRTGAAAGFFQPQNLAVPGTIPGAPATFRVRVWETAAGSYENAIMTSRLYGEFPTGNPNNDILVPEMGGMSGPGSTPNLDGMLPFTLVPEPSALTITAMGAILFFGCSAWRNSRLD